MTNATWTPEEKLSTLMQMPWTVTIETDSSGDRIARVKELPEVIGTGDTEKALAADLYDAIQASLESRLEYGDPIELPRGRRLPWDLGEPPAVAYEPSVVRTPIAASGDKPRWQFEASGSSLKSEAHFAGA